MSSKKSPEKLLGKKRNKRDNDEFESMQKTREEIGNDNKAKSDDKDEKPKVPSLFGVPLESLNTNLFSKEPLFKFGPNSIFSKQQSIKNPNDTDSNKGKDLVTTTSGLFSFKRVDEKSNFPNVFGTTSSIFSESTNKEPENLIKNPFSNGSTNSLFGKDSIFNSNQEDQKKPLFSFLDNKTSLFSSTPSETNPLTTKLLFNFNTNREPDKKDSDDEEGDDEPLKSDSPERGIVEDEKSLFTKKFHKAVDVFFVYNKEEKIYKNKGSGVISVEQSKSNENKAVILMFRNNLGSKVFDGIISKELKKFDKEVKNFKHIAKFALIEKVDKKLEIRHCKIPFGRSEDLSEFEKSFDQAISYLSNQ